MRSEGDVLRWDGLGWDGLLCWDVVTGVQGARVWEIRDDEREVEGVLAGLGLGLGLKDRWGIGIYVGIWPDGDIDIDRNGIKT